MGISWAQQLKQQHIMGAFICISTLMAAASAAPLHGLAHGVGLGHGVGLVGHGVGLGHGVGVVGHGVGLGHGVGVVGHGVHAPVLGHAVHAAPVVAHAVHAPVVAHAPVHHAVHAAPAYHAAPDVVSPYTYSYAVADDYSKANFNAQESSDGAGTAE